MICVSSVKIPDRAAKAKHSRPWHIPHTGPIVLPDDWGKYLMRTGLLDWWRRKMVLTRCPFCAVTPCTKVLGLSFLRLKQTVMATYTPKVLFSIGTFGVKLNLYLAVVLSVWG